MEQQWTQDSQHNIEDNNNVGRLILITIKLKIYRQCGTGGKRKITQLNRTESPEIDPINSHMISDKTEKVIQ